MNTSRDLDVSAYGSVVYNAEIVKNGTLELDEFLTNVLGPPRVSVQWLIPVTIFYVLIFVSGVAGNVAVCVVIGTNKTLHSAMNYYLVSLAVADLAIILLGVPNELSIYWQMYPYPFGEEFCKFRTFVSEMASYASVLTILSFSVERYLAICRPFHEFPVSDLPRTAAVTAICWLVATLASLPHLVNTKLHFLDFPWNSGNKVEESAFCAMLDYGTKLKWYPVHEVSFVLFFLLPILLLTFLYTAMALSIRGSKENRQFMRRSVHSQRATADPGDNKKQIIRMLVAVVILFFISWAPFHVQRLCYVYFKDSFAFRTINEYLMYFSGCLYFLSSTLNPVLYNLMSAKYRTAFRGMLCKSSTANFDHTTIGFSNSTIHSTVFSTNSVMAKSRSSTIASMKSLDASCEPQDKQRRSSHDFNKNRRPKLGNLRSTSLDQPNCYSAPNDHRMASFAGNGLRRSFDTLVEEKEETHF